MNQDKVEIEHISYIKEHGTLLFHTQISSEVRELYKLPYYEHEILVKLYFDPNINTYYNLAEFQEVKKCAPQFMVWSISTPERVYNLIKQAKPLEYQIISHRYFGEAKLPKPKQLKNIKSIGKVTFIDNHCNPQVFIKDNDVYIKHTDYFSSNWRPPEKERIDMPLSYYLKKYFDQGRNEKFVYADGWGSIVLRNEAWICLKNYVDYIATEDEIAVVEKIIEQQKNDAYTNGGLDVIAEQLFWERFWEQVYKLVKQNI